MTIERFRGEYFAFSNMYPLDTWIETEDGLMVPTSEHAYMADRFADKNIREEIAFARGNPNDERPYRDGIAAKELAHTYIKQGYILQVTEDMPRIALMKRVVSQKLEKNRPIGALLVATGNRVMYEGNNWNDRFWGVSPVGSRYGQNHLGRIYMELRENLRKNE